MTSRIAAGPMRLVGAAVAWLQRRNALVLLLSLAAVVWGAWYAATHIVVNTDTTDMLSPEVPFRRNLAAFQSAFPEQKDQIVVIVDGHSAGAVQAAARRIVNELKADKAHVERVDWPAGDPFFRRNGLLYLGQDEIADLSQRLSEAQPFLAAVAADPSLRGIGGLVTQGLRYGGEEARQLGPALTAMADVAEAQLAGRPAVLEWRDLLGGGAAAGGAREIVLVVPVLDYAQMLPAGAAMDRLRALAAELAADGITVRLTGGPALDQEEFESVQSGTSLASLVSFGVVALLLVLCLRAWQLILAGLVNLVVGLVLTSALGLLVVGRFNLISVTFIILFLGIGVDFGIHLLLRYREALGLGQSRDEALVTAATGATPGLTLTAICAAIGFLAFVPTAYLGLAELGILSAIGMFVALATTLTFLPALLHCLPVPRVAPVVQDIARPTAYDRLVGRRYPWLLGGAAAVAILGLVALPRLGFDFNPLHLKEPTGPAVLAFYELASDPQTTPYVIDVLSPSLEAAREQKAKLLGVPGVAEVMGVEDLVPTDQPTKLAAIEDLSYLLGPALEPGTPAQEDAAARSAEVEALASSLDATSDTGLQPAAKRLATSLRSMSVDPAQLAAFEQRLTAGLPALLDDLRNALQAGPVTLDDLPAGLRDQWLTADGRTRLMVRPAGGISDNEALGHFADAVHGVEPTATGTPVIITEAGRTVLAAFTQATVIAALAVLVLLAVVLRRVEDILLIFAPLLVAGLGVVATCVAFGLGFNFANLIALPLMFGLGVSGAVNLVMRQRLDGARFTLFGTSTPRAVVFSALTTVASCSSLILARHPGMRSMGILLTITIVWALFATMAVLPALLAWRRGRHAVRA